MNGSLARASVILVNYNSLPYVVGCLNALRKTHYENLEVIFVDNASSDGSIDVVEQQFPEIIVIRADSNLGFGGGNNLGAHHATGKYLAFLNIDTQVDPDWLIPLIDALDTNEGVSGTVGMTTPKLLMMQQMNKINTCGNELHIAGFGYLRGWMQDSEKLQDYAEVPTVSGAAFLMPTALFHQIGGFDDGFYPAYTEDTDLSWRVRLSGYTILAVPTSIVLHDYHPRFGAAKLAMLERHRYRMLLKNLRWRSLFVLSPVFLLAEVVSWGFAIVSGFAHIRAKLSSYTAVISQWADIMRVRDAVQSSRCITDRDILTLTVHRLNYAQVSSSVLSQVGQKLIDPCFYLLRRFALALIQW